ncbi:MAG TPA: rhomboid family intramembrane serine protease [Solirubrobacteraceae bacterium]|nr:rhomboid family intramembrane serine protease [Solirubrobacteraceae bacterium]
MFPLRDNLPTDRPPVVTIALILLNAFVYFFLQPKTGIAFEGGLKQGPLVHYGAIPYEFTHWGSHCDLVQGAVRCAAHGGAHQLPTALTIFSSMFTHAGLLHLGGNMLFLYIFGNNVEDAMGPVRYLLFYVLGGIAALALQTAVSPDTTGPTLGASGAIAAVLGGYILIYPRARVLTLIFIVFFFTFLEIPAFFFLFIWFGEQAVFGAIGLVHHYGGGGGVAYFAHVGGFVFGLAAIKLFATRRSSSYGGPRYPVY